MTAEPNVSPWKIRPLREGERARQAAHLPLLTSHIEATREWHWVITPDETRRLVGVARLTAASAPPPPALRHGILALNVRPAWAGTPAAVALIETVVDSAKSQAIDRLQCQIASASPLQVVLERTGFHAESVHEVWKLDVETCVALRGELTQRQLARNPLPVHQLGPATLAAAQRLTGELHLLTGATLQLATPQYASGILPEFSFICGEPDRPAGVILCRNLQGRLYLEVLGRNPAVKASHLAVVSALVRAVFMRAYERGIASIFCAITLANAEPVLRLLQRASGTCVERHAVMAWSS